MLEVVVIHGYETHLLCSITAEQWCEFFLYNDKGNIELLPSLDVSCPQLAASLSPGVLEDHQDDVLAIYLR